jgi:hypothetical protein
MTHAVMMRAILATALLVPVAVGAAPPGHRDPDWPCEQIKVPELSLAAVWAGPPVDPQHSNWQNDQEVADLVQQITPRREPIDQAMKLIQDFAQRAGNQKQDKLLKVLSGVFTTLGHERDSVMAGLDRFGRRQKELAAQIRDDNDQLHALQADRSSPADKVNQLTQQVTWEFEVFQDRRQALSYACAVPAKIEQRLFALARTIENALQ